MPWTTTTATRSGALTEASASPGQSTCQLRGLAFLAHCSVAVREGQRRRPARSVPAWRPSTERRAGGAPCSVRLDGQLIADRQATDSLPGRGEDRVAQRRRDRRHPRLAHTPPWLTVVLPGGDVGPGLFWRPPDAGALVGVASGLLQAAPPVDCLHHRR